MQPRLSSHLSHAGLPLPAKVPSLLLEFFHLLGMGCSGLLQLGPEVSKLRCEGIHCVLRQSGSSHLVLMWPPTPMHCPIPLAEMQLLLRGHHSLIILQLCGG